MSPKGNRKINHEFALCSSQIVQTQSSNIINDVFSLCVSTFGAPHPFQPVDGIACLELSTHKSNGLQDCTKHWMQTLAEADVAVAPDTTGLDVWIGIKAPLHHLGKLSDEFDGQAVWGLLLGSTKEVSKNKTKMVVDVLIRDRSLAGYIQRPSLTRLFALPCHWNPPGIHLQSASCAKWFVVYGYTPGG